MEKPWKFTLVVLLLALLVIIGLIFYPLYREPAYQGRSITSWLDDFAGYKPTAYQTALREIGTNAVPYAVRNLMQNDSWWHKKYAEWQPKLPTPFKKIFPAPKPVLQLVQGANLFFFIGSNSIPNAIQLLKHSSSSVRQCAAWGLHGLRGQTAAANQAIPALTEALDDPELQVRWHAAYALAAMGPDASNAVPALAKVLAQTGAGSQTNDFIFLRAVAAGALGKIGPAGAKALPELKATLQYTNSYLGGSGSSYLRGQAAAAILRISGDVQTGMPVLLQEMAANNENSKWDWIVALGEMGPRAKEAIPQLKVELNTDSLRWVLEHVTNALLKIDPTALPHPDKVQPAN